MKISENIKKSLILIDMKIILLLGLIIRLRRIVMIYNIANKMIKYANGNNYNIKHFLKVHAYAKTLVN